MQRFWTFAERRRLIRPADPPHELVNLLLVIWFGGCYKGISTDVFVSMLPEFLTRFRDRTWRSVLPD